MPNLPSLAGRVVAGDFETTGLSWQRDKIFGAGIAYRDVDNEVVKFYVDLRDPNNMRWLQDEMPKVKAWVNHYIKFDMHMAREARIPFPRVTRCTMIQEALIEENKYEYSLDAVSMLRLGRRKKDIWQALANIFGGKPTKEVQILNLSRAPIELTAEYAADDAELALLLFEVQSAILQEQNLGRLVDIEHQLMRVIIEMERAGVPVDVGAAEEAYFKMDALIMDNQHRLNQMTGGQFNANSGPQVKKLMGVHQREDGDWYTADGLLLDKTGAGGASLDSTKLQLCRHPAAQLIVDLRGMIKARDVFLKTYIIDGNIDGYIHATINQNRTEDGAGVYTGRLSITEPALQQIHKRNKKMAAIIRACFIPDRGRHWLCYDWSQMDFRMFAHFLNDRRINEVYRQNPLADFHTMVAEMTGLPRDRDEKTGGANAKQINLACVFGMGAGELARQCNLPYTKSAKGYFVAGPEAKRLFARYHDNIPGVRKLQQDVESVAKSRGYILTQLGRRIRFPNGFGAHKAAGLLYQSTAADAMKVKMIELAQLLESWYDRCQSRLMVTVHDEYNISADPGWKDKGLGKDIKALLERFDGDQTPLRFRIPVIADQGNGSNWYEASK